MGQAGWRVTGHLAGHAGCMSVTVSASGRSVPACVVSQTLLALHASHLVPSQRCRLHQDGPPVGGRGRGEEGSWGGGSGGGREVVRGWGPW